MLLPIGNRNQRAILFTWICALIFPYHSLLLMHADHKTLGDLKVLTQDTGIRLETVIAYRNLSVRQQNDRRPLPAAAYFGVDFRFSYPGLVSCNAFLLVRSSESWRPNVEDKGPEVGRGFSSITSSQSKVATLSFAVCICVATYPV